jgi:hypothetical protein
MMLNNNSLTRMNDLQQRIVANLHREDHEPMPMVDEVAIPRRRRRPAHRPDVWGAAPETRRAGRAHRVAVA